jgi:hypothetical protein
MEIGFILMICVAIRKQERADAKEAPDLHQARKLAPECGGHHPRADSQTPRAEHCSALRRLAGFAEVTNPFIQQSIFIRVHPWLN